MGYNLQEKVQVLAYTFHNLSSSKLIFSSKRQFHLHSSVIDLKIRVLLGSLKPIILYCYEEA